MWTDRSVDISTVFPQRVLPERSNQPFSLIQYRDGYQDLKH